jgi:hypothetical protein
MSDEERNTVLASIEQATITFYGHSLRAVRLPDGRIAAVLTDLCAAIGLERTPQARRIRTGEVLSDQLVFAHIAEDDGVTRRMDVLTAWVIPSWLTGIQLSPMAHEKRPAILAFKREAADVLHRHFSKPQPALMAPSSLVSP